MVEYVIIRFDRTAASALDFEEEQPQRERQPPRELPMKRDLADKLTSIVKAQWMRWKHRRVGNYDVFISYSHDPSRTLAFTLHDSLEKLSRNWYSFRALNVFLDRSSLGPTMRLEKELESIVKRSEWLVYICSENAAKSDPVTKELKWYIEHNGVEKFILIVDDGLIFWDRETESFSEATTNIPREVLYQIKDEPLWIDVRGCSESQESLENHPEFLDAVLSISSRVQNTSKEALLDRENKRQNRLLRFRRMSFSVLTILLAISLAVSWFAVSARNEALSNLNVATARAFASRANELSDSDVADSQLYAAQAWDLHQDEVTRAALFKSVVESRNLVGNRLTSSSVTSLAANSDATLIFVGHEDGTMERWETKTNALTQVGKLRFAVRRISVNRSGDVVVATGWRDVYPGYYEAEVKLWKSGKEECVSKLDRYGGAAVSPSGKTVALPPQGSGVVKVLRRESRDCRWSDVNLHSRFSTNENDSVALPDDESVVIQSYTSIRTYSLTDQQEVYRTRNYIGGPDDQSPVLSPNGGYSFGEKGSVSSQQSTPDYVEPVVSYAELDWDKRYYVRSPLPALSDDGSTAAVINADGLTVYDIEDGRSNRWNSTSLPVGNELSALAVPAKHVIVTAIGSNVSYWRMDNPSKVIREYESTAGPMCDDCAVSRIAPSQSGKYLVQYWNTSKGGHIFVLNFRDGSESKVEEADFLAWRTDEDYFAIKGGKICLYRAVGGVSDRCWVIPSWTENDSGLGHLMSNPGHIKGVWDGSSLRFSNGLDIWSFDYRKQEFSKTASEGRVVEMTDCGVVVSEDSDNGYRSGMFKVIYNDGKVENYDRYVWLANDGSTFSTSRNKTVVANTRYGTIEQRSYLEGSSAVNISGNGEYLAYVDSLNTVSVYSLAAGVKVGTIKLTGKPYSAAAVQFAPSGSSLYASYFDSLRGREMTEKVDLEPRNWFSSNCGIVRRTVSLTEWRRVTEMSEPSRGFACSSYVR